MASKPKSKESNTLLPDLVDVDETSSLRQNRIDAWLFERYEQRWDLMGCDTDKIAVLLPPRCRSLANEKR
ncbi:MAG: hypothetical protein ACO3CB_08245, partial [Ilumatobacteraceae bacterium]